MKKNIFFVIRFTLFVAAFVVPALNKLEAIGNKNLPLKKRKIRIEKRSIRNLPTRRKKKKRTLKTIDKGMQEVMRNINTKVCELKTQIVDNGWKDVLTKEVTYLEYLSRLSIPYSVERKSFFDKSDVEKKNSLKRYQTNLDNIESVIRKKNWEKTQAMMREYVPGFGSEDSSEESYDDNDDNQDDEVVEGAVEVNLVKSERFKSVVLGDSHTSMKAILDEAKARNLSEDVVDKSMNIVLGLIGDSGARKDGQKKLRVLFGMNEDYKVVDEELKDNVIEKLSVKTIVRLVYSSLTPQCTIRYSFLTLLLKNGSVSNKFFQRLQEEETFKMRGTQYSLKGWDYNPIKLILNNARNGSRRGSGKAVFVKLKSLEILLRHYEFRALIDEIEDWELLLKRTREILDEHVYTNHRKSQSIKSIIDICEKEILKRNFCQDFIEDGNGVREFLDFLEDDENQSFLTEDDCNEIQDKVMQTINLTTEGEDILCSSEEDEVLRKIYDLCEDRLEKF